MNNPFGIPDELMNAVISAAFKQQQEMKKGYKPENPFNIDPETMAKNPLLRQSSFMMLIWKPGSRRNRLLNWLRVS